MKKTSQKQPPVLDRNLLSKKQDSPARRITRPKRTESACGWSSPEGIWVHSNPPAHPSPHLPPEPKRGSPLLPALPFFPLVLLCSSAYRKHPEYLSGEPGRLPTCDLCQRDGDQPQLRAPHLGRGGQPHPGQMQHLPARRAQCEPHRVAAAQGTKQRQHFSF